MRFFLTGVAQTAEEATATARAILEERARRGGFRSTRDLLRIPGFGESRFARLKDHVRV